MMIQPREIRQRRRVEERGSRRGALPVLVRCVSNPRSALIGIIARAERE